MNAYTSIKYYDESLFLPEIEAKRPTESEVRLSQFRFVAAFLLVLGSHLELHSNSPLVQVT